MLGDRNPDEATKVDPESLRAKYGQTIIKNELYGSDTKIAANKDRDIFKFPIPQRIPDFSFDKYRISLEMLFKFLNPPNIEHSNINARLDAFAIYGPILNYHSVDNCFCIPCSKIGKEYIKGFKANLTKMERTRMGLESMDQTRGMNMTSSTASRKKNKDPVRLSPIRLLNEDGIIAIWDDLCPKCQNHCENFVHLVSGREQQHIVTDNEMNEMAYEMNENQL